MVNLRSLGWEVVRHGFKSTSARNGIGAKTVRFFKMKFNGLGSQLVPRDPQFARTRLVGLSVLYCKTRVAGRTSGHPRGSLAMSISTRAVSAPILTSFCVLYLVLGGANPLCTMTVADGPSEGSSQIGAVPAPATRVPCPGVFLGRMAASNGEPRPIVSVVPEGTSIEVRGYPCIGGS